MLLLFFSYTNSAKLRVDKKYTIDIIGYVRTHNDI